MTHPDAVIEAVARRISTEVDRCTQEMGRARGRFDAAAVLAALPPQQLACLHRTIIAPGLIPGTLVQALGTTGIITEYAQLFAPNRNGYFHIYCAHTTGMLLSDEDGHALDAARRSAADVAEYLLDAFAWALTCGWEAAVAEAMSDEMMVPA